jgi:membrane-associated protein
MSFINISSLLNSNYALALVLLILFIEVALPLIIGLPGDTLLITAGLFAAGIGSKTHHISILTVAILSPVAGFIGSEVGHFLGWKFGDFFFKDKNAKFFSPEKIRHAEKWMAKYGHGKAIFLGRFVPVVRGLINPVSGITKIPFRTFAFWNAITSLVWTQLFIWSGYLAGKTFGAWIQKYMLYIIGVVVIFSIIPIGLEVYKEMRSRKELS